MAVAGVLAAGSLATGSLAACSTSASGDLEPTSAANTSAEPSPTEGTTGPTTASSEPGVDVLVVPPAAEELPSTWQERFVIGYGPGRELLGTSPGGDSGSLDIGPEFGAPGPDGTWWFLDPAKLRIAHYDATGHFLDQARIPSSLLVDGHYFQWQLPHVMADGTLVASRLAPDQSFLLRLRDGVLDEIPVDGFFSPAYDDGTLLYGSTGQHSFAAVDPADGSLQRVSRLLTPSGTPFRIQVGNKLRIQIGDSSAVLPIRSPSGAKAHVGIEVRAGADDSLHLFMYGAGEDDESRQLVGSTVVSPDGRVSHVEALPDPFSEADSGSPAHLVIAPGSSRPMLVYVMPDGVHVYERTSAG
ncbi:hypothetical protein ISU10_14265 [Nocardioides agariphilus]|uniref:DUF7485 domain-containing protein n=1 Tax=Nocardioides agariphilus TaxID=433664 RepID=A0A930YJ60_9ACTN|nr:hypothetical protein [Nocardioides agariphilus]MBF4768927.1 hypothetical protein [Nocardioides agariphilus]